MLPTTIAICSFRLGGNDGVSIEAVKWANAIGSLGCTVRHVAGAGTAEVLIEGLQIDARERPSIAAIEEAFSGIEIVIVENLCSLALNPRATKALESVLHGRRAILHHHDLSLERPALKHFGPPDDDPAWIHVCVNHRSAALLAQHLITATVIHNRFDPDPPLGRREQTRRMLGVNATELLLLQPTRAIERKNIGDGLALAERLGATYWLTGPAEDGYGPMLEKLFAQTSAKVIHKPVPDISDAYAACDVVVLPSSEEGFGNPAIEAMTHLRPLVIGEYPVADELAQFGFTWFSLRDNHEIAQFAIRPDQRVLRHNAELVRQHFSLEDLPVRLSRLLDESMRRETPSV